MKITSIVAYSPKEGKTHILVKTLKSHYPTLLREGLVSDKPSYLMRSGSGIVIEVFEWRSEETKREAHQNTEVQKVWDRLIEISDFVPLSEIEESQERIANFQPID